MEGLFNLYNTKISTENKISLINNNIMNITLNRIWVVLQNKKIVTFTVIDEEKINLHENKLKKQNVIILNFQLNYSFLITN